MTDVAVPTIPEADLAPVDTFGDTIFTIPEHLQGAEPYQTIFDTMVERLRREAQGIPMSVLQFMLIERIASLYVEVRFFESNNYEGQSRTAKKELGDQWRQLVHEFHTLLETGKDKRLAARDDEHLDIVIRGLKKIEDRELRQELRTFYTEEFAALGD